MRLAIAPASEAHNLSWLTDYIAERCGAIVLSVGMGTPRPKNEIKQDTFLTPFSCSILKLNKDNNLKNFK